MLNMSPNASVCTRAVLNNNNHDTAIIDAAINPVFRLYISFPSRYMKSTTKSEGTKTVKNLIVSTPSPSL